jgi:hypothetical protein
VLGTSRPAEFAVVKYDQLGVLPEDVIVTRSLFRVARMLIAGEQNLFGLDPDARLSHMR